MRKSNLNFNSPDSNLNGSILCNFVQSCSILIQWMLNGCFNLTPTLTPSPKPPSPHPPLSPNTHHSQNLLPKLYLIL